MMIMMIRIAAERTLQNDLLRIGAGCISSILDVLSLATADGINSLLTWYRRKLVYVNININNVQLENIIVCCCYQARHSQQGSIRH